MFVCFEQGDYCSVVCYCRKFKTRQMSCRKQGNGRRIELDGNGLLVKCEAHLSLFVLLLDFLSTSL
jgi:hypothetical protein